MGSVQLIFVGGFLGAGKTTLLATAAGVLARRGLRVALVTNDQAASLVDSEILRDSPGKVGEVAGACFCCAFNRLLDVCESLVRDLKADVIIGEPVGSCTDLSATVLQPIKKYCQSLYRLAPFSVLVEPDRLMECVGGQPGQLADDVRYIYRKQIEEADLIVLNKAETLPPQRREELLALLGREFPSAAVIALSARREEQVKQWLALVSQGRLAGQRVVEVDYDIYARGEAALGWLNATAELASQDPTDWDALGLRLMDRLRRALADLKADAAHLKVLLETRAGKWAANLTATGGAVSFRGQAGRGNQARLILNARVQCDPQALQTLVLRAMDEATGQAVAYKVVDLSCFSPARPQPVHRFGEVVDNK